MIERSVREHLVRLVKSYPIVTITGPRQSGKTTLAKMCLEDFDYVSLEDIDGRAFAAQDPRGFLEKYAHPTIIDEVQRVPDLASYIQGKVDEVGVNGQYVLTGSQQKDI